MSQVTVRFYAGAAEAAGCKEERVDADAVGRLITLLRDRHGDRFARVLAASTVLVDGGRVAPTAELALADGATVEILPPYSGG